MPQHPTPQLSLLGIEQSQHATPQYRWVTLCTWNGKHIISLMQHPGECQLSCCALPLSCNALHLLHQGQVLGQVLFLPPRLGLDTHIIFTAGERMSEHALMMSMAYNCI